MMNWLGKTLAICLLLTSCELIRMKDNTGEPTAKIPIGRVHDQYV